MVSGFADISVLQLLLVAGVALFPRWSADWRAMAQAR
jgi:hypothetical protein